MGFDPELAEIRFGCGLAPDKTRPDSIFDMLERLTGPDHAATTFPIAPFEDYMQLVLSYRQLSKQRRQTEDDDTFKRLTEERRALNRQAMGQDNEFLAAVLSRRAFTEDGFRERLTAFWADHFTAAGRNKMMSYAQQPYVQEAIRPHVSGRFADMLKAATTHPMMLLYLDQRNSIGPNSKRSLKQKTGRGLNENLARELMELHTLGVGGPYSQADVRQLAELLTGLHYSFENGFRFIKQIAEPGAETVLGRSYGGEAARLEDIYAALEDLALHPATAQHLARKLAVHFIGDTPDEAMVARMRDAYLASGGHLMALYEAMLTHQAAWAEGPGNVKQPLDFVSSTLRALDLDPRHLSPGDRIGRYRNIFVLPMALMGQPWGQQFGPDGWPEADGEWITPQRLAARVQWAMATPFKLRKVLPDPRDFVQTALGRHAPEEVRFAAAAAESRPEGIGVVLSSPAFHRM